MATVELATKYVAYVDELFATESKLSLITNNDFDFDGAHSVRAWKVATAPMNDYDRAGTSGRNSRYGQVQGLDVTTQLLTLSRDRSFTFATDALDENETVGALQASAALARQMREVTIPEVDSHVYNVMCQGAGFKPTPIQLTANNENFIYGELIKASKALDDAQVPDAGRFLIVTPATYYLIKLCDRIAMATDVAANLILKGVIGVLDGCTVIKVPASRLPAGFGFMLVHPSATVAPVKLASFKIHRDPPGISGSLIEGRVAYDAFVLENKAKAIYYQETVEDPDPII